VIGIIRSLLNFQFNSARLDVYYIVPHSLNNFHIKTKIETKFTLQTRTNSKMYTCNLITLLLAATASAIPFPSVTVSQDHYEVLRLRASTTVDPTAVTGTTCGDATAYIPLTPPFQFSTNTHPSNIVFHDQNVAELAICGGIAGAITKCGGAPTSTTGSSGTALFKLDATDAGATINVSKGRWEGCVRAAQAVCPTGEFSSTCVGGASTGDVAFSLSAQ
jgi:hypothetical protein